MSGLTIGRLVASVDSEPGPASFVLSLTPAEEKVVVADELVRRAEAALAAARQAAADARALARAELTAQAARR